MKVFHFFPIVGNTQESQDAVRKMQAFSGGLLSLTE
jgi:hypothetical protein